MSKTLTIKYEVLEESEKDERITVDIVANSAPSFDWARIIERSHEGIVNSLKKSQKDEKNYKEQFIKETAEFLGKSEKEVREYLDKDDEKGAAADLLLEAMIKKLEQTKAKRKKND